MSTHGSLAGGTGFLFGNIDRRGRLEEDYLSDDAKDNLDHIGTKVTEKNRELSEIREALPGDKNVGTEQSDGQEIPQNPVSQDLDDDNVFEDDDSTDEKDDFDLSDEDRAQMAARALTTSLNPSNAINDEEDYDEDDEDGIEKEKGSLGSVKTMRDISGFPSSSQPLTSPLSRFAQPKQTTMSVPIGLESDPVPHSTSKLNPLSPNYTTSEKPSDGQLLRHSLETRESKPVSGVSPNVAHSEGAVAQLQQKLLENARTTTQPIVQVGKESRDIEHDDNPIVFSSLFARSPPRLNFSRPPRHTYGVVSSISQLPPTSFDDSDRLMRPESPPKVDSTASALNIDSKNRQLLYPSAPEICPRVVKVERTAEYKESAAPLVQSGFQREFEHKTLPLDPAPFELTPWEDNIQWQDSDMDDGRNESDWYEECQDTKHSKGGNSAMQEPVVISDSDDSDEFEDPVELNSSAMPKPKSPDKVEDSEDDMEWEDGSNPITNKANINISTEALQTPRVSLGSNVNKAVLEGEKTLNDVDKTPNSEMPNKVKVLSKFATDGKEDAMRLISTEGSDIVKRIIAPNKDLADGTWVAGIHWGSDSESELSDRATDAGSCHSQETGDNFDHLILDMNDPNMIFEHFKEDSGESLVEFEKEKPINDISSGSEKMTWLISSSGPQLYQSLQADRFNISNDLYYSNNTSQNLKLDRGPSIRRLQDAPPAVKIQTAPSFLSDSELLSYRRPKLTHDKLPKDMPVHALRRKRVKGGNAQIAGQIPKRKVELRCSEKDAYRVSLFEYALERQPCLLPIPGMASRLRTYARKGSAEEVQRADQSVAGTSNADTIFLGPDEPPPLAAGNIESNDKPLSVIESQLFVAPCTKAEPCSTDFLLVRRGKNMYVREIDSLVSVGLTEPKIEVMTPNTERYKKYGRERVYLWVMREFQRMRKEIDKKNDKKNDKKKSDKKKPRDSDEEPKAVRNPPYLGKEQVFSEFPRRRTYPETALNRALKDFGKFQNGRYVQDEDVISQYGNKEQEMMRILTPTETAAFESMESGLTHLLDRGIVAFTHPSGQGNILNAAESDRSGLESGPAVGKYIKSHLLKSPWYRSSNILSAHRLQRKDLLQALSLGRIVNDLKEGGDVMEAKLQTLSPTDMTNLLTQVFRYNSKKIPVMMDERRALIRDLCQRKGKGAPSPDVSDYPTIIRNVLKRHRDQGLSKGAAIAAMGTSMEGGTFLGIPLDVQRRALEEGDVFELPAEADDFVPDQNAENFVTEYQKSELSRQESRDESKKLKKGRPANAAMNKSVVELSGDEHNTNSVSDGQVNQESNATGPIVLNEVNEDKPVSQNVTSGGGGDTGIIKKKKVRLKRVKTVVDENGKKQTITEYITDPKEIEWYRKRKELNSVRGKKSSNSEPSSGGLKISIDMKKLGKASLKKKSSVGAEKVKNKVKNETKGDDGDNGEGSVKKTIEKKGQIGKIKINTKQLNRDKEQAALKRKRSQYSDDFDYRTKKAAKTSRKKRNGTVELNGILEKIETIVRKTEGYLVPDQPKLTVARLKDGESPPPGITANNLANPSGTALDFTAPVDTKVVPTYKEIVKKPMYLNLIRANCKQMKYEKASEFLEDMNLIVNNARSFNRADDVQWVVQHAELLYDVAVEQVSRRADEIKMAENMVAMEKLEAKPSKENSSKPKKKNKLSKNKGGSGSIEKKKKRKLDKTVTILDDSEERDTGEMLSMSPSKDVGLSDDIFKENVSGEGVENDYGAQNLVLNLDDNTFL